MNRPYRVGEIVLMELRGWLTACRVVEAHIERNGEIETVEYKLAPIALEGGPQWKRPG